jgi:hypothetical protein
MMSRYLDARLLAEGEQARFLFDCGESGWPTPAVQTSGRSRQAKRLRSQTQHDRSGGRKAALDVAASQLRKSAIAAVRAAPLGRQDAQIAALGYSLSR